MKHYTLKGESRCAEPSLFFEAKTNIQEVRSGYRSSRHGFFQAEWIEDMELNWAADMVREIRRSGLRRSLPLCL